MIYIIENNGVYGLTKGQFSATADLGSKLKTGVVNDLPPIDCCVEAIQLGATLVARSFSGDKRQLQAILKAAIAHQGLSVIDVISPCVTFNDHEGSTKSYSYMKEHDEPLHELDFVPAYEDIAVEIEEGAGARDRDARRLAPAAQEAGARLRSNRQDERPAGARRGGTAGARGHRNLVPGYRQAPSSPSC